MNMVSPVTVCGYSSNLQMASDVGAGRYGPIGYIRISASRDLTIAFGYSDGVKADPLMRDVHGVELGI